MKTYDNLKDGYGNILGNRVLLFIPRDELERDGTVGGYSIGNDRINNKSGFVFVIDKSDEDKIAQCKVVNGNLVIK